MRSLLTFFWNRQSFWNRYIQTSYMIPKVNVLDKSSTSHLFGFDFVLEQLWVKHNCMTIRFCQTQVSNLAQHTQVMWLKICNLCLLCVSSNKSKHFMNVLCLRSTFLDRCKRVYFVKQMQALSILCHTSNLSMSFYVCKECLLLNRISQIYVYIKIPWRTCWKLFHKNIFFWKRRDVSVAESMCFVQIVKK